MTPRYTSGDMAGLAIGMVFGGLLLAGVHLIHLLPLNSFKICPLVSVQHSLAQVIYFFALRNNVRAGIPVMRWWTMFEYCFRNDLNCF